MVEKLITMMVPKALSLFILNFLENRTQFVKLNASTKSGKITTNTGSPQGTVLSPFLFTIYTSDYRPLHPSCQVVNLQMILLLGLIRQDDDSHYRKEINSFVEYCDRF